MRRTAIGSAHSDDDARCADVGDHVGEVAREELVGVVGSLTGSLHQTDPPAVADEEQSDLPFRVGAFDMGTPDRGKGRHPSGHPPSLREGG